MKANIKRRATGAVAYAKKVGNLPCPQRCELCEKETSNLVAHHPDYSKPLEVVWLCHSCHSRVHASGLPFEEQDRLMRQITFLDGRPLCPYCGTIRMARAGGNPSGRRDCQRYKCSKCKRTWTDTSKERGA